MNKKISTLVMLAVATLSAGTYDYNYDVKKDIAKVSADTYLYGSFKSISRFDALQFDDKALSEDSAKTLEKIINAVNLADANDAPVKLTVIGYTHKTTDDENEATVKSSTYANTIIDICRGTLDLNESKEMSLDYAKQIKQMLIDNNVSEMIIDTDNRAGESLAFTGATPEGKELSNRVMVSLYELYPKEKDSDQDGVFDKKDECPNTPLNVKVDEVGCTIIDDLGLNFKVDSSEIQNDSLSKVDDFAAFLNQSTYFNIEVVGHTDSDGSDEHNKALSEARAQSVKNALVERGVSQDRISTKGEGEMFPLLSNLKVFGKSANRRIEVKLSMQASE